MRQGGVQKLSPWLDSWVFAPVPISLPLPSFTQVLQGLFFEVEGNGLEHNMCSRACSTGIALPTG